MGSLLSKPRALEAYGLRRTPMNRPLAGGSPDDEALAFEWDVHAGVDEVRLRMEGSRLLGLPTSCTGDNGQCQVTETQRATVMAEIMRTIDQYEVERERSMYFTCLNISADRCLSVVTLFLERERPYRPSWTAVITETGHYRVSLISAE